MTLGEVAEAIGAELVFGFRRYLDAEGPRFVDVADDLVQYCRGEAEGTDLQLSDSHDLPLAQAIAEEELALETGFDEDGLPFDGGERRFFPVAGDPGGQAEARGEGDAVGLDAVAWLARWDIEATDM